MLRSALPQPTIVAVEGIVPLTVLPTSCPEACHAVKLPLLHGKLGISTTPVCGLTTAPLMYSVLFAKICFVWSLLHDE